MVEGTDRVDGGLEKNRTVMIVQGRGANPVGRRNQSETTGGQIQTLDSLAKAPKYDFVLNTTTE